MGRVNTFDEKRPVTRSRAKIKIICKDPFQVARFNKRCTLHNNDKVYRSNYLNCVGSRQTGPIAPGEGRRKEGGRERGGCGGGSRSREVIDEEAERSPFCSRGPLFTFHISFTSHCLHFILRKLFVFHMNG